MSPSLHIEHTFLWILYKVQRFDSQAHTHTHTHIQSVYCFHLYCFVSFLSFCQLICKFCSVPVVAVVVSPFFSHIFTLSVIVVPVDVSQLSAYLNIPSGINKLKMEKGMVA